MSKRVTIKSNQLRHEEFRQWGEMGDQPGQVKDLIEITVNSKRKYQEIEGIGVAFSEIGGKALASLSKEKRTNVIEQLFSTKQGAGLNYCRLPIGSSDFALDGYSYSNVKDDYSMNHFSIERDREYLLPFIKAAVNENPNIHFHASPWSPPAWLKTNQSLVEGGSLIDSKEVYEAYAIYLRKYIEEYAKEGVVIQRLFPQNEPDAWTCYPGCIMETKQMVEFVSGYLVPELKKNKVQTQVWGGTFRTVGDIQMAECLESPAYQDNFHGIGIQYTQMQQLYDIQKAYPEAKFMHTESVCYNGDNSWEQAINLFHDFIKYMDAGCSVYTYWNAILTAEGKSGWGWKQNSLVTIQTEKGKVTYNPDYEVMKLLATYIQPGAKRIQSLCIAKKCIAFENKDGSKVVLLSNLQGTKANCKVKVDGSEKEFTIEPMTITVLNL